MLLIPLPHLPHLIDIEVHMNGPHTLAQPQPSVARTVVSYIGILCVSNLLPNACVCAGA